MTPAVGMTVYYTGTLANPVMRGQVLDVSAESMMTVRLDGIEPPITASCDSDYFHDSKIDALRAAYHDVAEVARATRARAASISSRADSYDAIASALWSELYPAKALGAGAFITH